MWGSIAGNRCLGRFFLEFLPFSPATNFIPPFLHTHLIHFLLFHYIRPCDSASGLDGRHPCYSQTYKIKELHRILCLASALYRARVQKFIYLFIELFKFGGQRAFFLLHDADLFCLFKIYICPVEVIGIRKLITRFQLLYNLKLWIIFNIN